MAVKGDVVLVSDPAAGEIVIVDAETATVESRIAAGGTPFDVLVVGGSGHVH